MSLPTTTEGNRLRLETSPYLQQHASNPVDWYPWGPEALERARSEDRPIFLSIGYSACHWCHVMEHESFQDPEIAALMNRLFVNIKVDREERPDLDEIYMTACQMLTGSGGWPLSVWLTPDLQPFHAGTYFPPRGRWQRPGFTDILTRLHEFYSEDRASLNLRARKISEAIARESRLIQGALMGPGEDQLEYCFQTLCKRFDPGPGGFGGAPKFPPFFALDLLLRRLEGQSSDRHQVARMLEETLDGMARGGIHDQIGGGFHRYSTDDRWLVPHFEKMLSDNALLVPLYLRAGAALKRPDYLEVAAEILRWCDREMIAPEGGFFSSQDADSEGVEGKFFVWTLKEFEEALSDQEDLRIATAFLNVTEKGNWEEMLGHSVLHPSLPPEDAAEVLGIGVEGFQERLQGIRQQLFEVRRQRPAPATDLKVLTAWNGLMISAYAQAALPLKTPTHLETARKAAHFCLNTLRSPTGLLRTAQGSQAHLAAYLEDYAYLAQGLLDLFEASGELPWLRESRSLVDEMIERFWDPEENGFFFTAHDHETLLTRTKNPMDNATPSGNSVATRVLLRLSHLVGEESYRQLAEKTLAAFGPGLARYPMGFLNMAGALDLSLRPPEELLLVGSKDSHESLEMARLGRSHLRSDALILRLDPEHEDLSAWHKEVPLVLGKQAIPEGVHAYLCQGGSCQEPVTTLRALEERLAVGVSSQ
jgi:uncharacterized protein YyaL (SSP411 family)